MDGSEPSSETGTRVCSMAMNPLYEEPELQELYVDLGELEAVNLMTFEYPSLKCTTFIILKLLPGLMCNVKSCIIL